MWKNRSTKIEFVSLGSGLMCPHLHGVKPLDTGGKVLGWQPTRVPQDLILLHKTLLATEASST